MGFKICFQAPDYYDEEEDKIVMSRLVCWLRMVITTIQYPLFNVVNKLISYFTDMPRKINQ